MAMFVAVKTAIAVGRVRAVAGPVAFLLAPKAHGFGAVMASTTIIASTTVILVTAT